MLEGKVIAFDTETTGLKVYKGDRLFAYTAANEEGETLYVEDDCFDRSNWSGNYILTGLVDRSSGPVRSAIKQWLADPSITKIFHNAKFDLKMLSAFGIEVCGPIHDTMIMGHVLGAQGAAGPKFNENVLKRLSLDTLAQKFLNTAKEDGPKMWLKGPEAREFVKQHGRSPNYSDVPLEIMDLYARRDAELTMRLYHVFLPHLEEDKQLLAIYNSEMTLLRHLIDMEDRGVRLDTKFMDERVKELTELEEKSLKVLVSLAPTLRLSYNKSYTKDKVKMTRKMVEVIKPHEINFNSDDQLIYLLYTHFGFPIHGWTGLEPNQDPKSVPLKDRGQPSVDERCLSRIDHPFCKELVRYRQYLKTRDTYYVGYRNFMDSDILHPNYNQPATQTGRLSASDPNLQNIPMEKQARAGAGADVVYKGVKRAFIPRSGFVNMHFDYSSIELRMFAHGVNDPQITDAVVNYDLHDWATELLFGPKSSMTAQEFEHKRVLAKIVNFGVLYGMGVSTFMWKMKKTKEEVTKLLAQYFGRLTLVKQFQSDTIETVRRTGHIRNVFGRRYIIDPHYAYKGVNYYCQGSAADVIKKAMNKVGGYLSDKKSNMLMTIHDEIVCEIHLSEIKTVPKNIVRLMSHNPEFRLPIKVSAEVADGNWENLKKVKDISRVEEYIST